MTLPAIGGTDKKLFHIKMPFATDGERPGHPLVRVTVICLDSVNTMAEAVRYIPRQFLHSRPLRDFSVRLINCPGFDHPPIEELIGHAARAVIAPFLAPGVRELE